MYQFDYVPVYYIYLFIFIDRPIGAQPYPGNFDELDQNSASLVIIRTVLLACIWIFCTVQGTPGNNASQYDFDKIQWSL